MTLNNKLRNKLRLMAMAESLSAVDGDENYSSEEDVAAIESTLSDEEREQIAKFMSASPRFNPEEDF
jgi:hypothetical protein